MSRRGPLEAELYEQFIEQGMDEMTADIMAAELADAEELANDYWNGE